MRRLVRRLSLSPDDAEVWLGMLRQMIWKMRSGQGPARVSVLLGRLLRMRLNLLDLCRVGGG